ncbi:cobyric acid synthase [Orenia marismortui]|uniref:cobyric acid synthase n=1 Tax=Orenia marismortui TaxID=46469 RepID=UPI00036EE477|nr:cobyric acid synthase [Orenia marismortui]
MSKGIMLQGTASNVGKSILATAFCRIFAQDGYQVAPFKSWNMALNSYVTKAGGEIGRAQAVQADAAGIEIKEKMQPILVKPKGEGIAQIIVKGKAIGDFRADRKSREYIEWALEIIKDSLAELSNEFEILVLEGAGSPAEINIKDQDIANMKVAKLNQTPVLLVADIDRGGALASVVGTLKLLEPKERRLVRGIILNKFRGDYDLLKPGIDILEEKTGKKVVGVIPCCKDFKIPDEDSLSLDNLCKQEREIKIGIINLPHISNFSDFDVLAYEPEVEVEYLSANDSLENYDLIIIPGTKNTTADLNYLEETGLAEMIINYAKQGKAIVGICGGYQILGKRLLDPNLTEGNIREIKGLALLDVETTFSQNKLTHQTEAIVEGKEGFLKSLTEKELEAYEIHAGDSRLGSEANPMFKITSRSEEEIDIMEGACSQDGLVWGTYLHGIFDNDSFRRAFINQLRRKKGLDELKKESTVSKERLEESYDQLAQIVRENIDLKLIYDILEEGEF